MTNINEWLNIFKELSDSSFSDDKFLNINVRLKKPSHLFYKADSFLDDKEHTDPDIFQRKLESLNGIGANFYFDLSGDATSPNELEKSDAKVAFNDLDPTGYFEYGARGLIGNGNYTPEYNSLEFNLYLSPQITKDIIDRILLAETIEDRNKRQESWVWTTMRIDIANFSPGTMSHTKNQIYFDILRIYCPH